MTGICGCAVSLGMSGVFEKCDELLRGGIRICQRLAFASGGQGLKFPSRARRMYVLGAALSSLSCLLLSSRQPWLLPPASSSRLPVAPFIPFMLFSWPPSLFSLVRSPRRISFATLFDQGSSGDYKS